MTISISALQLITIYHKLWFGNVSSIFVSERKQISTLFCTSSSSTASNLLLRELTFKWPITIFLGFCNLCFTVLQPVFQYKDQNRKLGNLGNFQLSQVKHIFWYLQVLKIFPSFQFQNKGENRKLGSLGNSNFLKQNNFTN